ncbi:MAG: hypothetical protein AAGG55_03945 [Pseudomonadota bacterium]
MHHGKVGHIAVLALITALLLSACGTSSTGPVSGATQSASVAAPLPEPVGSVAPRAYTGASSTLDIGIAVFDQGLGQATDDGRVFPTVRKAESLILPVILTGFLEDTGAFGVVRVVHDATVQLPLMITGEIREAAGEELALDIQLEAADGSVMLKKVYRDVASQRDYPVSGEDPFADLYRAIANDVLVALESLSSADRQELQRLSTMRFAAKLAPAGFERFIEAGPDGRYELISYPADGDPMLARLNRVRRQDELFIDTVDEQYGDLFDDVSESYNLWREYSYELRRYGDEYEQTAADRKRTARRGSYAAMSQVYASYRKVKIQEEDLRDLVQGFGGDALETVLEVDDGVFRLSGSVDDRYREWQSILARINSLETGDLESPPP